MQTLLKYFPHFTTNQLHQLDNLYAIYHEWNAKINVISRKDFENFYVNHVLHSISILKFFQFTSGTKFLDAGTGGGFPGIPLAICLPDCHFTLNDSIGKKMKVVEDVALQLKLDNIRCIPGRSEQIHDEFDFITGRAVSALPDFIKLIRKKISSKQQNTFPNGILYLKGGDFQDEIIQTQMKYRVFNLMEQFSEEFFATKKLVYLY
jgi:16S rRNA (guanine527-N7)-methyltransferase